MMEGISFIPRPAAGVTKSKLSLNLDATETQNNSESSEIQKNRTVKHHDYIHIKEPSDKNNCVYPDEILPSNSRRNMSTNKKKKSRKSKKLLTPAEMERLGDKLFATHEQLDSDSTIFSRRTSNKSKARIYGVPPTEKVKIDDKATFASQPPSQFPSFVRLGSDKNIGSKSKLEKMKIKTKVKNDSRKNITQEKKTKPKTRDNKENMDKHLKNIKSKSETTTENCSPEVNVNMNMDFGACFKPTIERKVDIVFPPLRSVLWDRRTKPGQSPVVVGADVYLPKLIFRRAALASLYHKLQANIEKVQTLKVIDENDMWMTLEGRPSSGLFVENMGECAGGLWEATIAKCSSQLRRQKDGSIRILVSVKKPSPDKIAEVMNVVKQGGFEDVFAPQSQAALASDMSFSTIEYQQIIKRLDSSLEIDGPPNPMKSINLFASAIALPGNRLMFRCEAFLPAITLTFTPIASLPVLLTPLARHLEKWTATATAQKHQPCSKSQDPGGAYRDSDPMDPTCSGFITLNQTRKAVLLLEDDPNAYKLPLVGVWIRANSLPPRLNGLSDKQSWQMMVQDPMILHACMRYLHNSHIMERVSPPGTSNTFLMLIYPRNCDEPSFLEVEISAKASMEQPTAFMHFETGFEVDIGKDSTRFFPGSDTISVSFHNVKNLSRRRLFKEVVGEILPSDDHLGVDTKEGESNLVTTFTLDEVGDEDSVSFHSDENEFTSQFFLGNHACIDQITNKHEDTQNYDPDASLSHTKTSVSSTLEKEATTAKTADERLKYHSIIAAQQKQILEMQKQIQRIQKLILGQQAEEKSESKQVTDRLAAESKQTDEKSESKQVKDTEEIRSKQIEEKRESKQSKETEKDKLKQTEEKRESKQNDIEEKGSKKTDRENNGEEHVELRQTEGENDHTQSHEQNPETEQLQQSEAKANPEQIDPAIKSYIPDRIGESASEIYIQGLSQEDMEQKSKYEALEQEKPCDLIENKDNNSLHQRFRDESATAIYLHGLGLANIEEDESMDEEESTFVEENNAYQMHLPQDYNDEVDVLGNDSESVFELSDVKGVSLEEDTLVGIPKINPLKYEVFEDSEDDSDGDDASLVNIEAKYLAMSHD